MGARLNNIVDRSIVGWILLLSTTIIPMAASYLIFNFGIWSWLIGGFALTSFLSLYLIFKLYGTKTDTSQNNQANEVSKVVNNDKKYFIIEQQSEVDPVKDRGQKVLISPSISYLSMEQVKDAIDDVACKIENKWVKEEKQNFDAKHDIIVGIDRGGAIVGGLLGKKLELPITTIGINYAKGPIRRNDAHERVETPIEKKENFLNIDFKEVNRVLLVDDAVRTGGTMQEAYDSLFNLQKGNHFRMYSACIILETWSRGDGPDGPKFDVNFYAHKYNHNHDNITRLPWDRRMKK